MSDREGQGSAEGQSLELAVLPSSDSMPVLDSQVSMEKVGLVEAEEGQAQELGTGTGSIASTAFNFVNTIVGSGIIGLPFAIQEAGLFLGLIELVLFAVMTHYSVHILVKCGKAIGCDDYQETLHKTYGRVSSVIALDTG